MTSRQANGVTSDAFLAVRAGQAAALLGEKTNQRVHALEVWAAVEIATLSTADHQPSVYQPLQMKGQGRGWYIETSH